MAPATAQNPLDRELAPIDERYLPVLQRLEDAIRAVQHKRGARWDGLYARFGRIDGDRRRIDHRAEYEEDLREVSRDDFADQASISRFKAQIADLNLRWQRERERVLTETILGPVVSVPMPALLVEADDRRLQALAAKRAKVVEALDERRATATSFQVLVDDDEGEVGKLDQRLRLGVVKPEQVVAARKLVAAEQHALREAREAVPVLVEQLAALERDITDRRREFHRERQAVGEREALAAFYATCDALLALMPHTTRLERLDRMFNTTATREFVLPWLSGDAPRSWIREYLQAAMERGWTPRT